MSMSQKSVRSAVGRVMHGYRVIQERAIPELHLEATLLRHEATGAGHLHLARPDASNLFAVQFRTTPRDSTGVAHILEHTVLCGSRRFPVRDPFFRMLTRSVSSFMNALTASDWTMYPFVTHNPRDFRNLMDVYMDAVLHPKLNRLDFMQEGWRLEPTKKAGTELDAASAANPLQFSGVVFNEMKGVFTDNDQRFAMDVQQALLPSHTYGVCSGGAPEHIPSLTWEQLCEFHRQHYHPSNARFYTYGDTPLEEHLQFLQEKYLGEYSAQPIDTAVPLEPRWTESRQLQIHCAPDPSLPAEQPATVATSFLMGDLCDVYSTFVDSFVGSLLVNGDSSPFYRALLESRLGQNYAPTHGFDSSSRTTSFHVGLKGVRLEDVDTVFRVTQETLANVAANGFDEKNVQSLLHQLELSLKHQSAEFGLHLVLGSLSYAWNHDADPIEAIAFNEQLARLRSDLARPDFLREHVRTRWLQNAHRLQTVMAPQESFVALEAAREAAQLARLTAALSAEQDARARQDSAALLAQQDLPLDTSCLPRVRLADMRREEPEHVLREDAAARVFLNEAPTNGVTYLRAFLPVPLPALSPALLSFVPLLTECMTRCGAGGLDYRAFAQQEELLTGGLDVSVHVEADARRAGGFECGLLLRSHCLDGNQAGMLELWERVFQGPALHDEERLTQLVQQRAANAGSAIIGAGHRYAMSRARGALGGAAHYNEVLGGLEQLRRAVWLGGVAQPAQAVQAPLRELAGLLMRRGAMRVYLAGESAALGTVQAPVNQWLAGLHQEAPEGAGGTSGALEQLTPQLHLEMPSFMVNYVARAFATVPLIDPASASLRVLAQLMTSRYLHRELREKGGAYGGGAVCSPGGHFSFFSYRDPNSLDTLNTFQAAVSWVLSGDFTAEDLEEAQLTVFKQLDAPKVAYAHGLDRFLNPSLTHELLQEQRNRLFAVSREQLIDVCQQYLVEPEKAASVIIGPANTTLDAAAWQMENLVNDQQ